MTACPKSEFSIPKALFRATHYPYLSIFITPPPFRPTSLLQSFLSLAILPLSNLASHSPSMPRGRLQLQDASGRRCSSLSSGVGQPCGHCPTRSTAQWGERQHSEAAPPCPPTTKWSDFITRWNRFRNGSNIPASQLTTQAMECFSEELLNTADSTPWVSASYSAKSRR